MTGGLQRFPVRALALAAALWAAGCTAAPQSAEPPPASAQPQTAAACPGEGAPHAPLADERRRLVRHGPMIVGAMLPGRDGRNISGPSPIRTPAWLPNRLGAYYLYFASHRYPRYIRLAYADSPAGPWRVADAGTVAVEFPGAAVQAVLAPEVLVDQERREIRMYVNLHFRRNDPAGRRAGVYGATSADGRRFTVASERLGATYSRVLQYEGAYYLFIGAAGQRVYRSADGLSALEPGPLVVPGPGGGRPYSRHVALQRTGSTLRVFYTRKLESPERILMGTIALAEDWRRWRTRGAEEILRPSLPYEGALLPLTVSRNGPAAPGGEHAVRDPAILEDQGRTWLYYTLAGECGIGLAELRF